MAAPTPEELKGFGKKMKPFERKNMKDGGDRKAEPKHGTNDPYSSLIYPAHNNGIPDFPKQLRLVLTEEIQVIIERRTLSEEMRMMKRDKCYLWVVDDGGPKLLWEGTQNLHPEAQEKDEVKHTNITGDGDAYLGGELFFAPGNVIHINTRSDRYGGIPKDDGFEREWDNVLAYFRRVFSEYTILSH